MRIYLSAYKKADTGIDTKLLGLGIWTHAPVFFLLSKCLIDLGRMRVMVCTYCKYVLCMYSCLY